MEPIYSAAIVLAFIAVGELVSIWSKARVPSLLVAMLGIFIFAQLGLVPKTVVDDSMMPAIYTILVAPILFHMGSLIPLPTLLKQWRSVIIALSGMLVAVLLLAAVVVPLFGFEHFVAGAGPLAGGIVATSLTTEGLTAAGVSSAIIVLPSLVLMMQSLPAMPMTNFLLRRFAISLRDSGELERLSTEAKSRSSSGAGESCGRRERRHGRRDEEEAGEPAAVPRRQPALQPVRGAGWADRSLRCWPSPPTSPRRSSHCSWASRRPRSASPRSGRWRSPTRSASRWPVSSRSSWHRW